MRVVLVNCPSFLALERRYHAHVPLGPLALAAVLREAGHDVCVVDPNRLVLRGSVPPGGAFHAAMARAIAAEAPDVVGFSTLSNSYHQVLRIAHHLKQEAPGVPLLLGGPHASVVDRETLERFPQVDFILRGEGEQTLPRLLEQLEGARRFHEVAGLTFRAGHGSIQRNAELALLRDLDVLPLPAYDLLDLPAGTPLPLDVGRGCPFDCAFCSTCHFWGRTSRLKSVERIVGEMRTLSERYGTRCFDIPHDLFTLDRRRVLSLCRRLREDGLDVAWSCFARVDCMDGDLLEAMAAAGCRAVAYGIESASPRMQQVIGKRLDLGRAREVVSETVAHGMVAALSFIVGFPEETREEAHDTVALMQDLATQGRGRIRVGCSPVVPYAGSRYWEAAGGALRCWGFPATRSPSSPLDAVSMRLVRRHPRLFSDFTWMPHPTMSYGELAEMAEVFSVLPAIMPATWRRLDFASPQVLLAAFHAAGGFTADAYRSGSVRGDGHRWLVRAFTHLAQVESERRGDALVGALAVHEALCFRLSRAAPVLPPACPPREAWEGELLRGARLGLAPGVLLRRLPGGPDAELGGAVTVVPGAWTAAPPGSLALLVPLGGLVEVIPVPDAHAGVLRGRPIGPQVEVGLLSLWLCRGIVVVKREAVS